MWRWFKVRDDERGFLFKRQQPWKLLEPGLHWFFDPARRLRLDRVSIRQIWIEHPHLAAIVGETNFNKILGEQVGVLTLEKHERALVWVSGRLEAVLGPGLYAYLKKSNSVDGVTIGADKVRELLVESDDLAVILSARAAPEMLEAVTVPLHHVGLFFKNGHFVRELEAGTHAFWRGEGEARVVSVDKREQVADISGQELLTSDNQRVRADAVTMFRVTDARKAVTEVRDYVQVIHRHLLLAMKEVVGTSTEADLLVKKDDLLSPVREKLRARLAALGIGLSFLSVSILGAPPSPAAGPSKSADAHAQPGKPQGA